MTSVGATKLPFQLPEHLQFACLLLLPPCSHTNNSNSNFFFPVKPLGLEVVTLSHGSTLTEVQKTLCRCLAMLYFAFVLYFVLGSNLPAIFDSSTYKYIRAFKYTSWNQRQVAGASSGWWKNEGGLMDDVLCGACHANIKSQRPSGLKCGA